jgi:hypothetical protein
MPRSGSTRRLSWSPAVGVVGPDVEGPDVEGPDVEGPDVEGLALVAADGASVPAAVHPASNTVSTSNTAHALARDTITPT